MQEITKAFWNAARREDRKRLKNGTKLLRFRIPGTTDFKWVQVFWKR